MTPVDRAPALADPIVGIRPSGDRAVLIELASLDAVLGLTRHLDAEPVRGQVDVVAAATTVLVVTDSPEAVRAVVRRVRTLDLAPGGQRPGELVVIETVYSGADLDDVAALTGLSREAVVAAHARQEWDAAFGGFAPGFAYLTGDGALDVPRRASPRTVVPAGSVALAGTYSAVYPSQSPGGWQLIGHTTAVMWDLSRPHPALIRPGDRVRFEPVREHADVSPVPAVPANCRDNVGADAPHPQMADNSAGLRRGGAAEQAAKGAAEAGLVVVRAGLQTTVQDLGRPGLAALGVSAAGAMDRGALRRANRMAGNQAGAAGLEVLFGGLVLRAERDQVLAVTGARVPLSITGRHGSPAEVAPQPAGGDPGTQGSDPATQGSDPGTQGGDPATQGSDPGTQGGDPASQGSDPAAEVSPQREAPLDAPFALLAGETLTLGAPTAGLRSYVAVRGGLDVPETLGSRSTDALSGIGPAPVAAGQALGVVPVRRGHVVGLPEVAPPLPAGPDSGEATALRIVPGPRQDWFTEAAAGEFYTREWTVTPQSNRVGLRLAGPALERSRAGELASEGTVLGSVQVPPNGQPVLFLADHPVTGGYPVIGVVVSSDLDLAAQLPPGAKVRFVLQNPNPEGNAHA